MSSMHNSICLFVDVDNSYGWRQSAASSRHQHQQRWRYVHIYHTHYHTEHAACGVNTKTATLKMTIYIYTDELNVCFEMMSGRRENLNQTHAIITRTHIRGTAVKKIKTKKKLNYSAPLKMLCIYNGYLCRFIASYLATVGSKEAHSAQCARLLNWKAPIAQFSETIFKHLFPLAVIRIVNSNFYFRMMFCWSEE